MSTDEPALQGRTFRGRSLRGSRFHECDLSGVVVRGCDVAGLEVDSPWLVEDDNRLLVNGVDVVPLVDAELDRRFPGRELRTAEDPDGLRAAWAALERTWASTLERAVALPADTLEASVDGEWSFVETLRHLVMATDTWLGRAVLERERPYHPLGLPNDDDTEAFDEGTFSPATPALGEVLEVWAGRQAQVREYVATVTADVLAETRRNPHSPVHPETVRSCLHTILDEEWEHHRYAVRDLDHLETP